MRTHMQRGGTVAAILMGLGLALGSALPAAAQQAYYIHADHLNTPRLIENQSQQVVWRWDNDDPFGANMANSNPSGLGAFPFNLRLPGQYFDNETNQHYNYFRDYSPETGRYIQSDPIGLEAGTNTYAYALNSSISLFDQYGLKQRTNSQQLRRLQQDPYGSSYSRQEHGGTLAESNVAANQSRQRSLDILEKLISPASAEAIPFLPKERTERICVLYRCKNPPGICPEYYDVVPPIVVARGSNVCSCAKYEVETYQPQYQAPSSFWPPR